MDNTINTEPTLAMLGSLSNYFTLLPKISEKYAENLTEINIF